MQARLVVQPPAQLVVRVRDRHRAAKLLTLPCSRVVPAWCGTFGIGAPPTQAVLWAPPCPQRALLARRRRPPALLTTRQPAYLCSVAPAAMVRRYSGPILLPQRSAVQTRVVLPSSDGSARALFAARTTCRNATAASTAWETNRYISTLLTSDCAHSWPA